MNKLALIPALCIILALFSQCKSDTDESDFSLDGSEISMSDIAGTWKANIALFSSAANGPSKELDIIENGGSFKLTIDNEGNFTATYFKTMVSSYAYLREGKFRFDDDLLVIIFDDSPDDFQYLTISHDEPSLQIGGGPLEEAMDFDDNLEFEDAYIDVLMERE